MKEIGFGLEKDGYACKDRNGG